MKVRTSLHAGTQVRSPDDGADYTVRVPRRREWAWELKVSAFTFGLLIALVLYLWLGGDVAPRSRQ